MSVNTATRIDMLRNQSVCAKCGSDDELQVDHVWPKSMGGRDEGPNLQVLCRRCNTAKGTHILKDHLLTAEWSRLDHLVDLDAWGQELADHEILKVQVELKLWRDLSWSLAERLLADRTVAEIQKRLAYEEARHEQSDRNVVAAFNTLRDQYGIEQEDFLNGIAESLGLVRLGEAAPSAADVMRRRLNLHPDDWQG